MTGEEEETVLYSHRAKLFRLVEGEWKERGLGDVKILRHEASDKVGRGGVRGILLLFVIIILFVIVILIISILLPRCGC